MSNSTITLQTLIYVRFSRTEKIMDSNNCSNDSESVREFLRQLEERSDTAMIPAVVMLVIFSVVGLAGNILVLVVYSKKVQLNPTKVLIMSIATFDLVGNVVAIPTVIIIMFDAWDFSRPAVCQVGAGFGSFTVVGAALCLVTVAVIRYRKVCRPYGWQVTIRQAVIASLTSVLLALIFSIPYFVIGGVRTRLTSCPNIKGHECSYDDRYHDTFWPSFIKLLFFFIYIVLSVSMVVLYTLIGVMAWKHSKVHGVSVEPDKTAVSYNSTSQIASPVTAPLASLTEQSTDPTNSHKGDTDIESPLPSTLGEKINQYVCTKQVPDDVHQPQPTVPATQNHKTQPTRGETEQETNNLSLNYCSNEGAIERRPDLRMDPPTKHTNPKRSSRIRQAASSARNSIRMMKTRLPVGRITAMLIIISAIYVLGFLPYLILNAFKDKFPEWHASLNQVELAVFNIAYRLYFLQSATNPIVYSLCDTNFRRNCIQLLTFKPIRHS